MLTGDTRKLATANKSRVSLRATKVFGQGRGVIDHVQIFLSFSLIIVKNLVAVFIHFRRVLEVHLRGGALRHRPTIRNLAITYKPHDAFVQYAIALLTPKTHPYPAKFGRPTSKFVGGAQGPSHL